MTAIEDAHQRREALDPARSFIVQAPAGSGKTGLLIQRYLGLLARVEAPEQILAMTFTRKAAAEMKSRILEALEGAQSGNPPGSPHAHTTWQLARQALEHEARMGWSLLENPARVKVQTIDSFCASLVRQMPLLSRTGGSLEIADKPQELYRETAHRLQHRIEEEGPIGEFVRAVFRHLDNSKSGFRDRIVELLSRRDQWMTHFFEKEALTGVDRDTQEKALRGVIETVLHETRSLFPQHLAHDLLELAAYAGENRAVDNPGDPLACLKDIAALPEPVIERLPRWQGLVKLLLTEKGEFRKKGDARLGFPARPAGTKERQMKDRFCDLLEALADQTLLADMLMEVRTLPDTKFSDSEWNVLRATLYLLPELEATLREVFTGEQKTDFTEIALSALISLGEEDRPTDLLLYLDHRIQHILVDEFQDTSYKQIGLLKLLTAGWEPGDGRTLFIVGDPMQSIYRFRDAEVGLFLKAKEKGIGTIRLEFLQLKTNFRSQKKIVDWVNECFSTVFPREDEEDLGAISYARSSASLPEAEPPGVLYYPQESLKDRDARLGQEADRMVQVIQNIREKDKTQSIALLVRARSHLAAVVERLKKERIVFQAEDIDPLTTRPEIQDLLALLRALVSPADRVAWLSILRAPWCGLSLEDLHRLCALAPQSPVWKLLDTPARFSAMSPDGQSRARRFMDAAGPALESLSGTDFRDLLEGLWIRLGGPACMDEATGTDVQIFFDEVSAAVETGGVGGLYRFDRRLEALFASPSGGQENPVQIMTMHKAKGLEFDHVLLPGLGSRPGADKKRLVFWTPYGDDLLIAPMEEKGGPASKIYDFLSRLDARKDEFESLRLLYVAATRAKQSLHLFGHVKPVRNRDDEWKAEKDSLLARLWPYLNGEWCSILLRSEEPEPLGEIAAQEEKPVHTIRRLPEPVPFPEPFAPIEVGAVTEMSEEVRGEPEFIWRGTDDRCLGNVLHLCFKHMETAGLENWKDDAWALAKLRVALLGEGISWEKVAGLAAKGLRAIKNTLEDPKGRWILKSHTQARSEYPLTGFVKGRFLNRILDRTFVDADGVRWIVDFKTGSSADPGKYKAQLDQYAELIALSGETRPIKKALYYPLEPRLIEL